jgi:hypothetical protein
VTKDEQTARQREACARYRELHRDRVRANARKSYWRRRADILARKKAERINDPAPLETRIKRNAYAAKYRAKNRAVLAKKTREWKARHPVRAKEIERASYINRKNNLSDSYIIGRAGISAATAKTKEGKALIDAIRHKIKLNRSIYPKTINKS